MRDYARPKANNLENVPHTWTVIGRTDACVIGSCRSHLAAPSAARQACTVAASIESPSSDGQSARARDLVLVASAALVPRLLVGLSTPDAGLFADMEEYDARAFQILREGTVHDAWRGPGYPALLAALYALPSTDIATARLANAPMGALTAALTTWLGASLVGRRGAVLAGVIVAFYPGLVLSSAYLIPEPLYTTLVLGSLIAATRGTSTRLAAAGALAPDRPRWRSRTGGGARCPTEGDRPSAARRYWTLTVTSFDAGLVPHALRA